MTEIDVTAFLRLALADAKARDLAEGGHARLHDLLRTIAEFAGMMVDGIAPPAAPRMAGNIPRFASPGTFAASGRPPTWPTNPHDRVPLETPPAAARLMIWNRLRSVCAYTSPDGGACLRPIVTTPDLGEWWHAEEASRRLGHLAKYRPTDCPECVDPTPFWMDSPEHLREHLRDFHASPMPGWDDDHRADDDPEMP